jgi:DNA-binding GntR family transcriptional regulator
MTSDTIQRESLTAQIKRILIERIVDGTLAPGERLKELQIAAEFGTSQAPVREALRSLQVLGYIEHRPHIGAMVRTYHRVEIQEAYQIRQALEEYCLLHSPCDLRVFGGRLETCLIFMQRAMEKGDLNSFTQADNDFHRTIVELSGNQSMLAVWEGQRMQLQVMATVMETSVTMQGLYALHPPIVAALSTDTGRLRSLEMLADHYRRLEQLWEKEIRD